MKISIRIFTVLTLLAASIFLTPAANGWSERSNIAVSVFSGTSNEEVRGTKIDSHGNIFTTGLFFGTVDFDTSDEIFNLTSLGNREMFVSKMDPFGNLLWAKGFGGTSDDSGNAISLDSSGNIYIAGNFSLSVDFDPGAGVANLVAEGLEDAFILKLDSSGNYLWAKSFGGSGYENATMALDSSGNAFVTGKFFGTVDFDPGKGTSNLISVGSNSDIFILKLDPSGNYLWAKSFGDVNADEGRSIAVDRNGYVYTTGQFRGTIDFDPGDETVNMIAGSDDVFISKLDSLGKFVWAKSMGGSEGDYSNSIQVDIDGSVYTAGQFSGTADFDPGELTASLLSKGLYDIFVSKLDSSGKYVWAKRMGGEVEDVAYSLTLDSSGNVYTTGRFKGTADFDPGLASSDLLTDGVYDIFISKLNSSGEYVWAKRIGGTTDDVGRSITTDSGGGVYTSGSFKGTVDFNPGVEISNFTSNGDYDIFTLKLDANGNVPSVAVVSAGAEENSKVATIPSGVTEAAIAKTTQLPAIKLNFGGNVPTSVTVVPVAANPAPSSATPFTVGSSKIVDIRITGGSFSGSVTVCLDGASTDRLYHYKNSAWVELGSRNYVNGQVCGVTTSFSPFVAAPALAPVYVAPTPVPYLKTLTTPKLNLKEGKLVCTPGTYNAGYTLGGVIQGSPTSIFSPSSYTYNLLINSVAQTSKVVTSASTSTSWELQAIPTGSLIACSVTVSANSLTNTDRSSDNAAAVSSALTTQSQAIKAAEAAYSESVSINSKTYEKALVDNRATWRKEIEAIQSNYNETLNRIKAKVGPKTSTETSAALKLRIAASKKSAADYAASKPAALAAKDAANKAALDAKSAAIAKANLSYGTFIESIGYGVLIP